MNGIKRSLTPGGLGGGVNHDFVDVAAWKTLAEAFEVWRGDLPLNDVELPQFGQFKQQLHIRQARSGQREPAKLFHPGEKRQVGIGQITESLSGN